MEAEYGYYVFVALDRKADREGHSNRQSKLLSAVLNSTGISPI